MDSTKAAPQIPEMSGEQIAQMRSAFTQEATLARIAGSPQFSQEQKNLAPVIHRAAKALNDEEFGRFMRFELEGLPIRFTEEEHKILRDNLAKVVGG